MRISAFITIVNVKDGDKGDQGTTATPSSEYALIYENTTPTDSTIWKTEPPSPWFLGLEYWSRTRYTWSDGRTTFSTPTRCSDMNALMTSSAYFRTFSDPGTLEKDLRNRKNIGLVLKAESNGYQNALVTWKVGTATYEGDIVELSLPCSNLTDVLEIESVLSYTRAGSPRSLGGSFTVPVIDVTEYTRCHGMLASPPEIQDAIDGDCFVLRSGEDFIPMVYENASWIQLTSENMDRYPDAMSKCGNTVVLESSDIPKTSTALYAYFSSLFSKSANIDFISTQDLQIRDGGVIRSTGKESIGDGRSGFIIKADGTSEFVGAVIRNADLTDTRIERLDADVLRTVNATVSGESFEGRLDSTPFWNMGSAVSDAMGKSSSNAITEKQGTISATHAEGGTIDVAFDAALYVTSETERTKERTLLSKAIDGSNSGTAYAVPLLPSRIQSSIRLGGSNYVAKITATGASCLGTRQYSFDGGSWTNYDSVEFGYETVKGRTIRLRQVLEGVLHDTSGCTRSKVGNTTSDTMYSRCACGNGRMVISNRGKLLSFPVDSPSSVSTYTLESYYSSVYGLAYGNGIFLATAMGSVQGRVLSGGSNGTSWSILSQEKFDNLFFANGYFHAHKMGTGTDGWVRSTNGSSWSTDSFRSTDPFNAPNSAANSSFCYGNGIYMQVCHLKLNASSVYKSSDGTFWSAVNLGGSSLGCVAFHEGLFVVHETDTAAYHVSGDSGVTWDRRTHSYTPARNTSMSALNSAFYSSDREGYVYKIPIVNGTPTSSSPGSVTATYSFKSYAVGLNLLDASGRKLLTLTTAESYHSGSFRYDNEEMTSGLPYYYKFGGIYKGGQKVASGSFDMFSSIRIAWNRIYNSRDSYNRTPSVVTWSGTSLTIVNTDNYSSRIRSNDLFSALSISFQIISEAKGAYTKDMYPQESGKYDIGSATRKYDQVHAVQFNGKLSGDVQGNLTGNSSGKHSGDVNEEGTTHKVWGAVWN